LEDGCEDVSGKSSALDVAFAYSVGCFAGNPDSTLVTAALGANDAVSTENPYVLIVGYSALV
jgi:hypothetical protein